ncbi:MAG: OmpH family outer membrane protein [Gammaproteobacteria bacterium]
MKKLIMCALLACSSVVFAADQVAVDKIAFVDGAKIIAKYEPQIDGKLQKEFKDQQDKLMALQKQLVDQNDKYKRDSATMSPDEVKTLQSSFEKNQADFQKMSNDFNQKRSTRANEELEKLLAQVRDASSTAAAKEGFTIVLQRGAALYVKNAGSDITDKVLALVQYK